MYAEFCNTSQLPQEKGRMDHSWHAKYQVYLSGQYISSLISRSTNLKAGNFVVQYSEKHQTKWTITVLCAKYKRDKKMTMETHRKGSMNVVP